MLWEERTGPLYKQLEHHYDSPALWQRRDGRAPRRAEGDRGEGRRGRARGDAAPPEPGVQALFSTGWDSVPNEIATGMPVPKPTAHNEEESKCWLARIHAKEDLRIEAVDTPTPGPGEVLLRLGAAGICGSDLHYYFEGRNGSFVVREPLIPGHEASGVVAAVGRRRHAREGGRQRCGARRRMPAAAATTAAKGREHLCTKMKFLGSASLFPHVQGMFSEYLRDGRAAVLSGCAATSRWASSRSRSRSRWGCTRSTAAAICSASRC